MHNLCLLCNVSMMTLISGISTYSLVSTGSLLSSSKHFDIQTRHDFFQKYLEKDSGTYSSGDILRCTLIITLVCLLLVLPTTSSGLSQSGSTTCNFRHKLPVLTSVTTELFTAPSGCCVTRVRRPCSQNVHGSYHQ